MTKFFISVHGIKAHVTAHILHPGQSRGGDSPAEWCKDRAKRGNAVHETCYEIHT
jgi:hypothetical protein